MVHPLPFFVYGTLLSDQKNHPTYLVGKTLNITPANEPDSVYMRQQMQVFINRGRVESGEFRCLMQELMDEPDRQGGK